ncbi:hypothetical protein SLEP1_g34551 [Rubroshorea leprosula]|uniref:Uncharacterized protein n=1 Tax=Rubroshorea leprosula TaxID=152421 RepID=A0AAV5KKN1_9ROSI|nr:hypothetical protein SLEP1_g34551 [Rubroshorea leprosula]
MARVAELSRKPALQSRLTLPELAIWIWGLEFSPSTQKSRICSASSSFVRRVLLGLNPSAIFCREFPLNFLQMPSASTPNPPAPALLIEFRYGQLL